MWKTTIDKIDINVDDKNQEQQFKRVSIEITRIKQLSTRAGRAPIVSFDEDGDIPFNKPTVDPIPTPVVSLEHDEKFFIRFCCQKRLRRDLCHLLLQFFFSQIGLSILVFLYVSLGGLIFYSIESKFEMKNNEKIQNEHSKGLRNIRLIATEEFNRILNESFELRYALWRGMISRHDGRDNGGWRIHVDQKRFDRLLDDELARMQTEQEKLTDKHDSRSDVAYNQKWTFSTAMLFSATVITTVGYGNITPKSVLGKIITCLYAMFGIPIMIMCLTNTGDLLAFFFIKYYSALISSLRRWKEQRSGSIHEKKLELTEDTTPHVPIAATFAVLVLYIAAGAALFSHWEGWSYVDGAYFSFITFTTIGLGDLVPGKGTLTENKNGKSILCAIYLLFGLVLTAMCFKLMQDDLFLIKQRLFIRLGLEVPQQRFSVLRTSIK